MQEELGHLKVIDLSPIIAGCSDRWANFTLTRVNDSLVRLGIFEGEFHWHKHDREDEFFYVVDGELLLDLEDATVTLRPRQGYTVPKGIMHRTRASARTIVLMVETATVNPRGD